MPNIDAFDVFKAVRAAFLADQPIKDLLGDPPRIHDAVPKLVAFPWTRVDTSPMAPGGSTRISGTVGGLDWIHRYGLRFVTVTKKRSKESAADILKAISDVMDNAPTKLTIAGAKCFQSSRGLSDLGYDPDTHNAFSWGEWTLWVDPL